MLCSLICVIPAFEKDGLLPPGIHWSIWSEIAARFGTNEHRRVLLGGLRKGIQFLGTAGCKRLFIDGSFVTRKEIPADYDVCWDTEGVDLATLRDLEPAFVSFANGRALQKTRLFGEFFPAASAAEVAPPFRTFLNFFQQDKITGLTKGIVGYRMDVNNDH
jgi:hypothetical protein